MESKKTGMVRRLRIIQGQIDGIIKLIENNEEDCFKVISQMKAIKNGFQSCAGEVVKSSITHCKKLKNPDEKMESIIEMFTKF